MIRSSPTAPTPCVLVYAMLFAKAEQTLNFQIIKGNFYLLVKFALYLVCIYWSTQAFIKYQSEPAITTIKYEFDKNQHGRMVENEDILYLYLNEVQIA